MRPLTEDETKILFLKLAEYIGKNVEKLINRNDERYCFRLLKDRVYYVSESLMKASTVVKKENLLHVGCCLGKFTKKSNKFRLHITSLEYLSQYAKVRFDLLTCIMGVCACLCICLCLMDKSCLLLSVMFDCVLPMRA